jgi:hypothetical protein
MVENRRNSSSVILVISLMIIFFSLIQREKEKNLPDGLKSSFVLDAVTNSSTQAIITSATASPEFNPCRINPINGKYTFPDCTSSREFVINKLISSYFSSCQLKFPLKNPIIGLIFLQKIPGHEKEDDLLSVT